MLKMSDMSCVSMCVLFGVEVETENGLMGPKHVGA